MPLNRYQIRNEYSLADPELYRAADKDDPEALLEGVAMAGLVGVLRQLGDLAEFAAEIFHDLHEEVMVTAARGHSLMGRVQQLEAEFPTIEKAFLSQTNHSSFFYNSGLDWHPNMRMDQSLITQGDLPRFVMDSYEECRGPPRLFLLDKFDVAGAGACLKRYSDPSFFKVELSSFGITGREVQREKKARKAKKKGSRWRNGEIPEALPTPHAKLHQLFLEERIENGTSDPARQVRLKRRLNGFPFTSKSGKSYMEKFLKSPSPDHKEVHEIPVDPSTYESAFEIAKISTVSPERELDPRSISLPSSPAKEEIIPGLFEDNKLNEVLSGARGTVMLQSNPDIEPYDISDSGVEVYNIPSDLQMEDSEKEIAVDDGSKTDDSIDDYQSDDIASETDNYSDALTTMESEMDTDSEFRMKNDLHYLNSKREARGLGASDVQLQTHSSDPQSMGNSTLSDYGNSMSKKEISSFSYSDTQSTAAENTHSDGEVSCNIFPSTTETHETEIIDSSLDLQPFNKENPQFHPAGSAVLDGLSAEAARSPTHSSEIGDQAVSPFDSDPSCRNTEAFTKESAKMVSETDDVVTNPSLPCENQLMDESEGRDKDTSEFLPGTSFLSVSSDSKDDFQLHLLAENKLIDELNDKDVVNQDEDVNQDANVTSMTNQDLNDNSPQINRENLSLLSPADHFLNELHGEDLNLSNHPPIASDLSDSPSRLRDVLLVAVPAENLPVKEVVDEYPSSSVDGLSNMAAEKKSGENSMDSVSESGTGNDLNMLNSDDNQIGEQNLGMLLADVQPLGQTHSLDAEPSDTVSKIDDVNQSAGEADNATPKEDNPSELVEPLVSEINAEVLSIWSLEEQTSCSREVYFDEPLDTGDGAEMNKAACNTNLSERDSSVEPLLMDGNHGDLDERDTDSASATAVSSGPNNNAVDDDDGSSGDLKTLREVCDAGPVGEVKGLITDEACLLETPAESGATEGLHRPIYSFQGSNSGFDQLVDNDQSESELQILNDVSGTHLLLEANDNVDATTATPTQTSFKQNELEFSHTEDEVASMTNQLDQPPVFEANSDVITHLDQPQFEKHTVSGTHLLLEANDNVDATTATPTQMSFKQNELEFSYTEDKVESMTNQLDQPHVFEANSEVITHLDQSQYEKHIDHVGPLGSSSNSVPIKLPSEPSDTEFSVQGSNNINITGHLINPSSSILSSFSPLPDSSHQIYVDEMPPMPPLPPVQWRMTKFQYAPPGQERVSVQNSASALPPLFPSKADQDTQPVNQLLPQSVLGDDNSHPVTSQFPSMVHHGDLKDSILPLQGMQYRGILQLPGSNGKILQNSFQDDERENEKSRLNSSSNLSLADTTSAYAAELPHEFTKSLNQGSQETSLYEKELMQSISVAEENVVTSDKTTLPSKTVYAQPEQGISTSAHAFGLSNKKLTRPLNQETPETSTKEEELGSSSGHLEKILVSCDNNSISAKTENEQPQDAMSTSEATLALPVGEENQPNGVRPTKLPRPRNPLIDAVAAHDKSKLRKVTERVRPQIQKEDERDSLLEQIRTKSFNLKPAVVTRPSIPGPTTNLKVAAILEKAKTIRQAFAGSDEDDDDSWSDS